VNVDKIGSRERSGERTVDPVCREQRSEPQDATEESTGSPRHPRDFPRQRARRHGPGSSRAPGRMRDVFHRIARRAGPFAELTREQRIGCLVGRQMRRHVQDVHQSRQ
jgi:hypothetical protein